MSENNLLNPHLYNALVAVFGHVKIKDAGVAMRISGYQPATLPDGRRRLQAVIAERGETYIVSCPFCSDTRFRLYINHRWAERDPVTNDRNLFLAHCFNEHCFSTGETQWRLAEMLYGWRPPQNKQADDTEELYPEWQRSAEMRPRKKRVRRR